MVDEIRSLRDAAKIQEINAQLLVPSEAQAVEGLLTTGRMTPQRTKQHFDGNFPLAFDAAFDAAFAEVYDPQGIEDDAFDRGNHTGTLPSTVVVDTLSTPNLVRTADWKFSRILDIADHRDVVADGVKSIIPGETPTNNTPFIQEMIDYAQARDRTIGFSAGWYCLGKAAGGNYCLKLNARSHVIGMGRGSQMDPQYSLGVVSNVDTFLCEPEPGYGSGWRFEGIFTGSTANGRKHGRDSLFIDTRVAGVNLPSPTIRGNIFNQSYTPELGVWGSGKAIRHTNDAVANVNGGMYGAKIEDNTLAGGILLTHTGDSIEISGNSIPGRNSLEVLGYRCLGFDISCIDGGDGMAGSLVIADNSITVLGAGGRIQIFTMLTMRDNFFEIKEAEAGLPDNMLSTEAIRWLVKLGAGDAGTCVGGEVYNNRFGLTGGVAASVTAGLYLRNTTGIKIGANQFSKANETQVAVVLDSDTHSNIVEGQQFPAAWNDTKHVRDLGYQNFTEHYKDFVLIAPFTNVGSGYSPARVSQNSRGDLLFDGYVNTGGAASGTTAYVLPADFRPLENHRFNIQGDNSGTPTKAFMDVLTDGTVKFYFEAGTNRLGIGAVVPRRKTGHMVV